MTNTFRTSQQSGRSMVEMLGVLAIVGVLSIGGVAGYSKAMAKYKINKTLDQVSMLITGIRTAYGNQNSYTGLNNTQAVNAEIAGSDLTLGKTDGTMQNAYQGSITITAAKKKDTTPGYDACTAASGGSAQGTYCPAFAIKFDGLDRLACATIASADWGGTAGSGLISIDVGGKLHTWSANGGATGLPIDYATALSDCGATGGTGAAYTTKAITWVYY